MAIPLFSHAKLFKNRVHGLFANRFTGNLAALGDGIIDMVCHELIGNIALQKGLYLLQLLFKLYKKIKLALVKQIGGFEIGKKLVCFYKNLLFKSR